MGVIATSDIILCYLNITVLGSNLRRNEAMLKVILERFPGQTFAAKDDERIVGGMKMVEWPPI